MEAAQRWVLSTHAIQTLCDDTNALDGAFEHLGGAPRPRNAAVAMAALADGWEVVTREELEGEVVALLDEDDGTTPGYRLGRAASIVQQGYAAYLLERDNAWALLVRIAKRIKLAFEGFRGFAESYCEGAEMAGCDEDEMAEMREVAERLLSDPKSPWVALGFDVDIEAPPVPPDLARTHRVDGRSTLSEALAKAVDGDRIIVSAGTYRERIHVSTPEWGEGSPSVEIIGEGRVVFVGSEGPIVEVDDGGLLLHGVCIQNDREAIDDVDDIEGDAIRVIDGFVRLVKCEVKARPGRGLAVLEAAQLVDTDVRECALIGVYASRLLTMERCNVDGCGSAVVVGDEGEAFLHGCKLRASTQHSGLEVRDEGKARARRSAFEGHGSAGVGVFDKGRVTLEGCTASGNTHSGLGLLSGHVDAVDCTFEQNVGAGVLFDGGGGRLTRCVMQKNGQPAVWVRNKSAPALRECTILSHENGGGVVVLGGSAGSFSQCTIEGSAVNAVEVHGKAAPSFRDCVIRGRGGDGVLLTEGGKPVLQRCELEAGQTGMFIEEGAPRVERCKIHGNEKVGIVVRQKGKGRLLQTDIENNPFGIQIAGQLSVHRSRLTGNKEDGVYVFEGGDIDLEDCEIAHNGDCGVRSQDGHVQLVGCRIHHAKAAGVFGEEASRIQVDACDVFENGDEGVYFFGQAAGTVKRSHLHDNTGPDLIVEIAHGKKRTKKDPVVCEDSALGTLTVAGDLGVTLRRTIIRKEVVENGAGRATLEECVRDPAATFHVPWIGWEAFLPCTLSSREEKHSLILGDDRMAELERVTAALEARGIEPNGYGWTLLIDALVKRDAPELEGRLEMDPEAGMMCIRSRDREALARVAALVRLMIEDPEGACTALPPGGRT